MGLSEIFSRIQRSFDWDDEAQRDLRLALILAAFALLLYLPGINWGMPLADSGPNTMPWGVDELGPIEPMAHLGQTFSSGRVGNPQYPLFHYIFITLAYIPYLLWKWLTGGLTHPGMGYPYGFTNPQESIRMLLRIGRIVSSLMGAGTAVAAFYTAKQLWDRTTGLLAGLIVAMLYPVVYYSRTTNVDVPALFWCSIVLYLFSRSMSDGLPLGRALALGFFAALAVATKDQSYAVLLFLPIPLLYYHFRYLNPLQHGDLWSRWSAPLSGGMIAGALYVVASGLVLRPAQYFAHLAFIRTGAAHGRFYFKYAPSLDGYLIMGKDISSLLVESMGWVFLLTAALGILWCARHSRGALNLLLPIPGLFLGVLLPVRFVALRFLLPVSYVLALFAARGISQFFKSKYRLAPAFAVVLLLSGAGILLARDADLTIFQWNESRNAVTAWLTQNAHPGDRVEYFAGVTGEPRRRIPVLPHMPVGVVLSDAAVGFRSGEGQLQGKYVLVVGVEDIDEHLLCPRWVHEGLRSGSLGYDLAAEFDSPARLRHQSFMGMSPRIEIYKRREETAP